jgi:hypothetical protein
MAYGVVLVLSGLARLFVPPVPHWFDIAAGIAE